MARRNEHSLVEIKAMVLAAAETIITDEGFEALTIRKIAMEMGYTVGSIYMVFKSRAELILHLNAHTLEQLTDHLQAINPNDLETWLQAYLHYAHTNAARWRMIFTPRAVGDEPLPDWYQARLNALFQQFAAYFPEPDNPAILALWQGIHGICLLSTNEAIETNVLLLLRIFLRGSQSYS
jgi:AcrR family transcriptional regulator